jgi:hypothetical protein
MRYRCSFRKVWSDKIRQVHKWGSGVSPDNTQLRQDLETTPTGVDFIPTRRELISTRLEFTPTKRDFPPNRQRCSKPILFK